MFYYIVICVQIVPINSIFGCDHVTHRLAQVKQQPQFIFKYQLIPLKFMMENLNIASCRKKNIYIRLKIGMLRFIKQLFQCNHDFLPSGPVMR